MATKQGPMGVHDDPESPRSKAPPWRRAQMAMSRGALHAPSPHEGSKGRMVHVTDVAQDQGRTARPERLPTPRMGAERRRDNYARQAAARTGGFTFADSWRPTGPQRRRIAHKARMSAEQRAGLR